jgi:hypothetical protein
MAALCASEVGSSKGKNEADQKEQDGLLFGEIKRKGINTLG